MSEPSSAGNGGGDGIPPWMTAVAEETFYNASREPPSEDASDSQEKSTDPFAISATASSPEPETDQAETPLHQKLSVSMGEASELPEPDPNLQPTVVGHVRADLNRHLEKAVSVLNTRYAKDLPKSLVLEFAIRRILLDLQEEGEKSALVEWLDTLLPRL